MKAGKSYLENKEQKSMLLVVSRWGVHFDFEHPFFACPIEGASEFVRPKNRGPRKKFVHRCADY